MRSYILCASPRSGSTLLCDLLWQTGVAGKPNAFFRPASVADWCDWWDLPRVAADAYGQDYLQAAIAQGTQGSDIFGLRIMWDNMAAMLTRLRHLQGGVTDLQTLTNCFGPCQFIHLSRKDKVAEAVSLTIAEQTGLWHRNADGTDRENFGHTDTPVYDAAQIQSALAGLNAEAAGWAGWFAANAITPHRVSYESLSRDPQSELAKILAFLRCNPAIAKRITPGTQQLATSRNHAWAARFRQEHGLPPAPQPS